MRKGTMRNRQRLERLREWTFTRCCEGRSMKTPVARGSDYDIAWAEPRCFLGSYPPWAQNPREEYKVAPSILILTGGGLAAGETDEYIDSRSGISRPKDIGATLTVQLIHALYEPGERTGVRKDDGRADPREALQRNEEADEGHLALIDWMDDTMAALIGADAIPDTDLIVNRKTVGFELLKENGALADRRPLYLGFVTVTFSALTRADDNPIIDDLLS